jgi:ketosteroid isomerase-like protein
MEVAFARLYPLQRVISATTILKMKNSKMKALKYSLLATVLVFKGLGMGFAQDVDPQVVAKIHTVMTGIDDAYKKGDAAAVTDFFAPNAIIVTPDGPIKGHDAILKYFTDMFQVVKFTQHTATLDSISKVGDVYLENGGYNVTFQVKDGAPTTNTGYWSANKGVDFKVLLECWNSAPAK